MTLHRRSDGAVLVARKRWGHGRMRQIAYRIVCRVGGHDWSAWDWRDEGVRGRRCMRSCGTHHLRGEEPFAVSYDDLEAHHADH